jgi:RNA polymerase sigma-70 factor (ECF subfamily)
MRSMKSADSTNRPFGTYNRLSVDEIALAAERLTLTSEPSELVRRARRGNIDAFEQIMRAHGRQVYRVAARLLGNDADAQDAAQEVFLRLHRSLSRIDEDRQIGAWLYRVTVNLCNDVLRTRHATTALPELRSREDTHVALEVQAALDRLPERQRAAIVLREIEGLSTAEVAEILGSTKTTVRSSISIAKSKLRQWLVRRPR